MTSVTTVTPTYGLNEQIISHILSINKVKKKSKICSVFLIKFMKRIVMSGIPISHTSAATFYSAFTSVIGWRTDMHKARYFRHKVEWNSAWTDIVSPIYNVYHYFQEENPMVQPALFAYAICLYQITPSSATNNPSDYHSTICRIFTYSSNMKQI